MSERCTSCNWSFHLKSAHTEWCKNNHPLDTIGRYKDGKCKLCQRAQSKKWRDKHLEQARANWRRWYAQTKRPARGNRNGFQH